MTQQCKNYEIMICVIQESTQVILESWRLTKNIWVTLKTVHY